MELLISVTIIGIIIVVVNSSFKLGYLSVDKGEDKVNENRKYLIAMNIIRNQLNAMCRKKQCEFEGLNDQMTFYTYYGTGENDVKLIHYRFLEHSGNGSMDFELLEEKSFSLTKQVQGKKEPVYLKLLTGLENTSFEYLDSIKKGQFSWQKDWKDKIRMPLAIRVLFEYQGRPVSILSRVIGQ